MTFKPTDPVRQRMVEDMTIRGYSDKTQSDYLRVVADFAFWLDSSPNLAGAEDLRAYQLALAREGASPAKMNACVSALRFFFKTTMGRPELGVRLARVRQEDRLPEVLSLEEVALLLHCTPNLKHRTALSVAYGCGLRVSEIVRLKVSDIDVARMLLRVEQGKGRSDRYVMLAPELHELLQQWWRTGRPKGWLFPGREPGQHLTTRQLDRVCKVAAANAGLSKKVSMHTLRHSFATHLLENGTDIRVIQALLGHKKLDTTSRYTRVALRLLESVRSPLSLLKLPASSSPGPLLRKVGWSLVSAKGAHPIHASTTAQTSPATQKYSLVVGWSAVSLRLRPSPI